MKKKFIILTLLSTFALSGCFLDNFFEKKEETPSEEVEPKVDPPAEEEEKPEKGEQLDFKQVGEFYGGVVKNKFYTGYEFSKSQETITKPTSGIGEVTIFAFNDFHGAVLSDTDEAGLKYMGTFYKEKSQLENTLIIDQGDTYQGSFESNYQYGAIVQDVFNYAGVSIRTVGNHDIDWGLDKLESLNNRKIGDDYIPSLCANIYDYANHTNGTIQQGQYGKEYGIFTLDNGIKVGVIGVIGKEQISTICSNLVENICFTDHIEKAMEMSDYLRTKKECDIIVVSAHEGMSNMAYAGLSAGSGVSHKRYADLVLCGHEHTYQLDTVGGVKYIQWDSNGQSTGSVKLKFNFETNSLIDDQTEVTTYNAEYYKNNYSTYESTIEQMVDDYLVSTSTKSAEVLSTNFSGYYSTTALGYMMSEAIYDAVKTAGYTVDFAVCNYARKYFKGTNYTFGDLYRSFPFDNQIIIMDIANQTSYNSLFHNMTYRESTSLKPDPFGHYKIAVVDYIGLHQNANRNYDYFPGATNLEVFKPNENEEAPVYRDILMNYLKNNPAKDFSSSNYSTSNKHFTLD